MHESLMSSKHIFCLGYQLSASLIIMSATFAMVHLLIITSEELNQSKDCKAN